MLVDVEIESNKWKFHMYSRIAYSNPYIQGNAIPILKLAEASDVLLLATVHV